MESTREGSTPRLDVLAEGLRFPEGPAFDADGLPWLVELQGEALVNWSPAGLTRVHVGGAPNGLALASVDELWFCDAGANSVRAFQTATGITETMADAIESSATHPAADSGPRVALAGPNDLAFDSEGNCIFTCPGGSWDSPVGYVCCRKPDGTVSRIAEGLHFPNGLAFVDGGNSLVVAETRNKRLWRGSWDPGSCSWSEAKPWADVGGDVGPDGMALGADGLLYVAIFGGGCVAVVDPQGRIARTIDLPGRNPTNCAFDPSGQLGLVVTESEKGLLLSIPEAVAGAPLFTRSSCVAPR